MSFSNLVAALDSTCLATFSPFPITIHFQSSLSDLTVTAIPENPALKEDYVPGSIQGTSVLILFIHLTTDDLLISGRYLISGDTATVNGVEYDIFQVDTDREDGRSIRLRRRS